MPDDVLTVNFWPGNPLSYTTTRISVFRNDILLSTATGFTMKYGQDFALVTNWHVLSGYNPATGKCLSKTGALPNRIECHVSVSTSYEVERKQAERLYFKPLSIDLLEGEQPIWLADRADDVQNDYAAIPLEKHLPELKEGATLRAILGGRVTLRRGYIPDASGPINIENVRSLYPPVGSEVFVLGYPHALTSTGIFPLWKRASIASEPQGSITLGGCQYENAFYIDALTKAGMSGSPVVFFAKIGDRLTTEDGVTVEAREAEPFIIGVYAGREGITQEEYELSVGRVWKIGSVERMLMKKYRKDISGGNK